MIARWKSGLLALLALLVPLAPVAAGEQLKTVVEWRFDTDKDFRGWSAGGHIAEATVTHAGLSGRATGLDPILMGPVFDIPATPSQCIEIKMKASQSGQAELYWTNTLEGQYGGFSSKKLNLLTIIGAGEPRVYRIHPLWHAAGKIIRLRFDPPNKGEFQIEWIRIVDDVNRPASQAAGWRFDTDRHGWRAWQEISEPVVRDGCLRLTTQGKRPIIIGPPLAVAADKLPLVCVRMAASAGSGGRVMFASSKQIGWQSTGFPLRADGKMHWYTIDVGALNNWRDEIVMLAIQPSDTPGAEVGIESIEICDEPRGPAELEIVYFGRTEGVNRAGRPAGVTCTLRNQSGQLATGAVATLTVEDGATIVGSSQKGADRKNVGDMLPYLANSVSWQIQRSKPGSVKMSVQVEAPGVEPISSQATMTFSAAPELPELSYVPEPRPVTSKYEIGAFYFPGWCSMSRWRPILDYPARKPVLGWYDEANPQCVDWQIKWAVEHGVTFFMVDWYWCQGNRHLEHWLHDGYMKAKYRKYLKWAVMWANHNRPDTHSPEDWKKVTRYWIDNYFSMKEYYRIDGRPVVFIWAPGNIRRDVGGSTEAAGLYAMSQAMARKAGLPGIHFAAMSSHHSPETCKELKSEGYQSTTSYHGFQLARKKAGSKYFPFADVVRTSPELWRAEDARADGLPYMPIVDTGWASQPWHHGNALVIRDRTPELFGELCREARKHADATGRKIIAIGPWNEWGEGSYIEPCTEFGFKSLEQMRDAFCDGGPYPPNLIPSDIGLGPYDLPPIEYKTAWQFNTAGDNEGWMPNGDVKVDVSQGLLVGETTGRDPVLHGPAVQVAAKITKRLLIRMRSTADSRAQVFWATSLSKQSEKNSVQFDVVGDGQFHDYAIELGECRQWRGVIRSLRIDPTSKPGVRFAIDRIELQ